MKQNVYSLVLAAALSLLPFSAFAASSSKTKSAEPSRVEVVFQDPDKFTDVKDSSMNSDKGRDGILDDIRTFVVDSASRFLPAGAKLKITFTEIDLAGEYEPWRGPSAHDVRIVKDIYPPRFDFSYVVTDETGAVIKEGKEQLRDMSFMMRLVIDRSDPLRFEKDMLQEWMRSNLRPSKK